VYADRAGLSYWEPRLPTQQGLAYRPDVTGTGWNHRSVSKPDGLRPVDCGPYRRQRDVIAAAQYWFDTQEMSVTSND